MTARARASKFRYTSLAARERLTKRLGDPFWKTLLRHENISLSQEIRVKDDIKSDTSDMSLTTETLIDCEMDIEHVWEEEDGATTLFKSTSARIGVLQGIFSIRTIGNRRTVVHRVCQRLTKCKTSLKKHTVQNKSISGPYPDGMPWIHREYSGFPGCSGRGDSSALSGVMATLTSILLIVHTGKKWNNHL